MAHEETVRMVPGAKTAVLFMHGIAGTPDHFRVLLPLEQLVPQEWSVYNVLMDGHGKKVEDFSHSSMEKWKRQVMGIFDALCRTHEQVILVGHSMGTLFAVQMALHRPEKVPFLFLIASPMRVGIKLFGVINLIRLSFGVLNLNDPVQAATSKVSSITQTRCLWRYFGWIPRLVELLAEMDRTAGLLGNLRVPCVAFQSKCDELISCRSCKLLRQSGRVKTFGLGRSTHFYYDPGDIEAVQTAFTKACKQYI